MRRRLVGPIALAVSFLAVVLAAGPGYSLWNDELLRAAQRAGDGPVFALLFGRPFLLVIGLFGAGWSAQRVVRWLLENETARRRLCPKCFYSLEGLPQNSDRVLRCPECGTGIPPR